MARNKSVDSRAYWIWLQHAFSAGSVKPMTIARRFASLNEFYIGGKALWSSMSFINDGELRSLENYDIIKAEAMLEYAEKSDQSIITPDDDDYPELLKQISNPPSALYVRGEVPEFDDYTSIGIVGSRKTDEGHLKNAEKIAYELSKSGAVVISGGALGVDAAAHRGAMKGITPTVAFLGCGLDYPYLMENELLRRRIIERGGALISEYPPDTPVQRGAFQVRNRLISAVSRGVVIVSAKEKSGSMITAKYAVQQNKDLFAVPGNPEEETSAGTNKLLKDGAIPVTSGYDIIEYYSDSFAPISKPVIPVVIKEPFKLKTKYYDMLTENAKRMYNSLSEAPKHISRIMSECCLKPSDVLSAATELELVDLAESLSGQRFRLKKK